VSPAQLGTCCGSDPNIGLAPWVKIQQTGGIVAIDTAYGYKVSTLRA
jgi:hypothetical protein